MVAVAGYTWAVFGLILVASAFLIVRATLSVLRRLKELGAATRGFTEELSEVAETINEQLRRARDGMGRLEIRRRD